jgi:hypothetical protein
VDRWQRYMIGYVPNYPKENEWNAWVTRYYTYVYKCLKICKTLPHNNNCFD